MPCSARSAAARSPRASRCLASPAASSTGRPHTAANTASSGPACAAAPACDRAAAQPTRAESQACCSSGALQPAPGARSPAPAPAPAGASPPGRSRPTRRRGPRPARRGPRAGRRVAQHAGLDQLGPVRSCRRAPGPAPAAAPGAPGCGPSSEAASRRLTASPSQSSRSGWARTASSRRDSCAGGDGPRPPRTSRTGRSAARRSSSSMHSCSLARARSRVRTGRPAGARPPAPRRGRPRRGRPA